MDIYSKIIGSDIKLSNQQRVDYALLFVSVLLQQIHPVFVCVTFILILCRDICSGKIYKPCCFYNLFVSVIFMQFLYCGFKNANMTFYNAIWYSVPSVLAILLGHDFANKITRQEQIIAFLFLISLFLALPHIIVTFYDIVSNGLVNPDRTLSIEGYDNVQRAVTARTVELSLAISGISALFLKKLNAPIKISNAFIILAIAAELCTLHYVSRTGIMLMVIALISGFLLNKISIKQLLGVVFLCFIAVEFFQISGLSVVFSEREIDGSSIADAGGRSERWLIGLIMLFENPAGYNIEGWYAHNFWLDFGRVGGLTSFIMLSLFSVSLLVKTLKLNRVHVIGDYNCLLITVISVIFIATLFTEPVHSGAPLYMYFYFLFAGFIDGLYNIYK